MCIFATACVHDDKNICNTAAATRQLADPNHDSLPHSGGDETALTNTRWHIKHGVSYVLEEAPHDFGHAPAIMRYALEMDTSST